MVENKRGRWFKYLGCSLIIHFNKEKQLWTRNDYFNEGRVRGILSHYAFLR
jgi:hypothetical protein